MLNGAAGEKTQRSFAGGAPRGLLGRRPDNSSLVELGPYNNVSGSASILRPARSSGSPFLQQCRPRRRSGGWVSCCAEPRVHSVSVRQIGLPVGLPDFGHLTFRRLGGFDGRTSAAPCPRPPSAIWIKSASCGTFATLS